jgi:hypothetical protein
MKRLSIRYLSAITALGLVLVPTSGNAQQKSLKDQLVGTWNITSVNVDRNDGTKVQPFGPNPKGVLTLTSDGHFTLVNTRPGRSKFASNNRLEGTPDENKATVQGVLAYFGTYTVNEGEKMFTLRIDASSFPNDEGTEQKRLITALTGDEMKFTNPTGTLGGAPAVLTLTRAK